MMRRTQTAWAQLKIGIVILIAVAGILVAIMNLNEGMGVFSPRTTFRAHLDDSLGIKVGAPVRMSGVDVGNVKRIAIESVNGKVALQFTVSNEVRPLLHTDAVVLIRPMGLLGDKYLEILPGSPKQPPLPEGAVLSGRGETDITGVAGSAAKAAPASSATRTRRIDFMAYLPITIWFARADCARRWLCDTER